MAAEFTTKVRIVRCPKCRLLLPELPNFEVYRCGGCSTFLQAKNRLNGMRSRSTGLNGTVAAEMNATGNSKEDTASSSTSCNGALPDSGGLSSDQIYEKKNESKSSGDESKLTEGSKSSSSSLKGKAPVSEEYSLERTERKFAEGNECSTSGLKASVHASGECSSDGIESSSSSPKADVPDSAYFSKRRHEMDENKSSEGIAIDSSPKAVTSDSKSSEGIASCSSSPMTTFPDSGERFSDHNNENQNCYGERGTEPLEDSRGIPSSAEFARTESKASLPISRASSEALNDDESGPLESDIEVDIEVEIDSDSTTSSRLNAVATRLSSSIFSAHMPPSEHIASDTAISSPDEQSDEIVDFNMDAESSAVSPGAATVGGVIANMAAEESISSGTLTSSPNEQLSEPRIEVQKSFDHRKSSTTFETTDFHSPRSEFSTAIRDRSKSPTTRSHHAYDASVSSYDGVDDQYFYNHRMDTFQDAYKSPNLDQSEHRFRKEKFFAESMGNRGPALPNQTRSFNENGHATRYRNPGHDPMLPPRIPVYPSRDHARMQRNQHMSRMASLQEDVPSGYGNGRFTNPMQNEFLGNLDYQSDRSVCAAAYSMALRRIVYDLQNQVNSLNIQATRQEHHIPMYNNYEASEELHGLNHPRGPRRSRPARHYSQQQSQYRPIPFSSEATTGRHQADSTFIHRYPQDRRFSAPLPHPVWSNTNGLRRASPDYALSQWDNETMSDDQRHKSREVKKYYKEKQQMPKRHFLPIAGGAPILICYKCLSPLQMPADFLLFKRKCHRLQCGACSKVLEFSLHKRASVCYGMSDDTSEVEGNSYGVNADPVSCSDDYGYGLWYCQSGSTEAGDHAGNIAPANSLDNTIVHELIASYGSNNPSKAKQETVLRRSQSQNKDRNAFMSARTSSHILKPNKYSSEMGELPPKSISPLHRLMGYKSPSQVFKGIRLSRSGSKNSGRS